jgi:TonB family protein
MSAPTTARAFTPRGQIAPWTIGASIGAHFLFAGALVAFELIQGEDDRTLKPEQVVYVDFSASLAQDDLLMPDKGERTPDAVDEPVPPSEGSAEPPPPPEPTEAPAPTPEPDVAEMVLPDPAPKAPPPKPSPKPPAKVEPKVEPKPAPKPVPVPTPAAKTSPKSTGATGTGTDPAPKNQSKARDAALKEMQRQAALAGAAAAVGTTNRAATGMGPATGPVGLSSGRIDDPEMAKWIERARSTLNPHFTPLPSILSAHPDYKVTVIAKVAPDGTLKDPEVEVSSGDPSFDNAAVNAILKARRLSPVPSAWTDAAAEQGVAFVFRAKDKL